MIPSQRSDFTQCIDPSRPHELLTKDTKWSGCLEYRYTDDGTTILVPNVPYNQPRGNRAGYFNYLAGERETAAADIESGKASHALLMTDAERKARAAELRAGAARLRTLASVILTSGPKDQVAQGPLRV